MQYKSFIILLRHAYFLNPYINVARCLLAYKLLITNSKKEHYRVVRTKYPRQGGDDDGASQYIEKVLFKQVSSSLSESFAATDLLHCLFLNKKWALNGCKNATIEV